MDHRHSKWEDVPPGTMRDVISRRVFTGEKAMVAQVFLSKDAVVRCIITKASRSSGTL